LEGDKATTAIWELEIFGGRPSWKATGLQLQSWNSIFFGWQAQSENSWFLPWWLVVRRQGYNDKYRGLVTVDFTLSDFSAANPVTTAIWELNFFWWQAELEGDRATTAIWDPFEEQTPTQEMEDFFF